eukprot:scaffold258044_cov15-Tisochrysis_lutea.AAC.1
MKLQSKLGGCISVKANWASPLRDFKVLGSSQPNPPSPSRTFNKDPWNTFLISEHANGQPVEQASVFLRSV